MACVPFLFFKILGQFVVLETSLQPTAPTCLNHATSKLSEFKKLGLNVYKAFLFCTFFSSTLFIAEQNFEEAEEAFLSFNAI